MLKPAEIAENCIGIAQAKTKQVWYKTFLLAILAGVFIALAGATAQFASAETAGTQGVLLRAAVFPVGLILVVLCGAELFTGNNLLIAPTLNRDIKITALLKNWGIVYLGNFIGSTLVALLVVYSHALSGAAAQLCVATATAKSELGFGYSLLRGILCNILVCLAVWGAMSSKNVSGKIFVIYLPVFAFVVCGFEHSVANMYYLMSGVMAQAEFALEGFHFGYALLNGLLAPTLGNLIGGGLLAVTFWATFFPHKKERKEL